MRIEGEHVFKGSREDVWAIVRDPEVLATMLPGTTKLTQLSETEYETGIYIMHETEGSTFTPGGSLARRIPAGSGVVVWQSG